MGQHLQISGHFVEISAVRHATAQIMLRMTEGTRFNNRRQSPGCVRDSADAQLDEPSGPSELSRSSTLTGRRREMGGCLGSSSRLSLTGMAARPRSTRGWRTVVRRGGAAGLDPVEAGHDDIARPRALAELPNRSQYFFASGCTHIRRKKPGNGRDRRPARAATSYTVDALATVPLQ